VQSASGRITLLCCNGPEFRRNYQAQRKSSPRRSPPIRGTCQTHERLGIREQTDPVKVALHFSLKRESPGSVDGYEIGDVVLRTMISHGDFETPIRTGDLLLRIHAMECRGGLRHRTWTYSESKYLATSAAWVLSLGGLWKCFLPLNATKCLTRNVFVICLDNISLECAKCLSFEFGFLPYFLGALEVDDHIPLHALLYSDCLMPWLRVAGKSIYVFKDYFDDEESLDSLESFTSLGAVHAEYETP
jgi:hypothetical protein